MSARVLQIVRYGLSVALVLFCSGLRSWAANEPNSFTIDLPFPAHEGTPAWLGRPVSPSTTFASVNVPITSLDPEAALLVTVFYEEKQGGFLRVIWHSSQRSERLSDNLYEGIGMKSQRSLLLTSDILQQPGTLQFQTGDTSLGITRITFRWLERKESLVSPAIPDMIVMPELGPGQLAFDLSGQVPPPPNDGWKGSRATVSLTTAPMRIEQGVEFSVQLDSTPAAARLALNESGLTFSQHLVVWINQKRAGVITPVVPDLADSGYAASEPYAGWRDGSYYVPIALLKAGVNTIQFSTEDEDPAPANDNSTSSPPPLAVKNVVLQCSYSLSTSSAASQSAPTPATTSPAASNTVSVTGLPEDSPTGPVPFVTHPDTTLHELTP